MRSVGVAWVEGVQTAGEEEGVFGEVVVQVVVYELPQLGVDRRGRRRHGGRVDGWCGVCCAQKDEGSVERDGGIHGGIGMKTASRGCEEGVGGGGVGGRVSR